ncbi:unnamed protein product [Oikopleura dioica]|uniref:Olfactomedin-like domain-containing protein n=1 Tax=Oikopleura dioica TaxID=34765 RepID=E4YPB0_OIKDI|nr:unnamed protein product [Oikopleura dioica]
MAELIVNITYVAEREDQLVHGVLDLSKRMDKVSDKLNVVNRQIRSLDASVPHERTVKIFGVQEAVNETDDILEENLRNLSSTLLNVQLGPKDVEAVERVGAFEKSFPRATIVYLGDNDVKRRLIHASAEKDVSIKVIDNRPYGTTMDPDRPEDCNLGIAEFDEPVFVSNFSLVSEGAWLTDSASNGSEIYVFQQQGKSKTVLKFNSTEDLFADKVAETFNLPHPWYGTGHVVYNGALYYVREKPLGVIRYEFAARRMRKQKELDHATIEECTYEDSELGGVELAVDETGLWVTYCNTESHGNIVLTRLDLFSLENRRTYHSTLHRNWLMQSFIACGVYYGFRSFSRDNSVVVKYAFNSHTFKVDQVSEKFGNFSISQANFDSRTKRIYFWTTEGRLGYSQLNYKMAAINDDS